MDTISTSAHTPRSCFLMVLYGRSVAPSQPAHVIAYRKLISKADDRQREICSSALVGPTM